MGTILSRSLTFAVAIVVAGAASALAQVERSESGSPQNVILFISDGTGVASFSAARDYVAYRGKAEQLAIDDHLVGMIKTHASDSRVTDSAASATAMASGVKSYNAAVGVDTAGLPLATIFDGARDLHMQTGLVATSRITHATPAAFATHAEMRWAENEIAADLLDQRFDLVFGGGRRHFVPDSSGGRRDDNRNLLAEAAASGYSVASTVDELSHLTSLPALGLFASSHLDYEIDRDSTEEPSLAEMTATAIDLLSSAGQPFFLMVEGSRIDHSGHGNDIVAHVHGVLAFDDAFEVAIDFARTPWLDARRLNVRP